MQIAPAFEDLYLQRVLPKAQAEKFGDKVVHVSFEDDFQVVSCEIETMLMMPFPTNEGMPKAGRNNYVYSTMGRSKTS